ncbi:tRNA lysidine(34) synthetase TilS [Campylobacter blaseri]|uniref:tRNA(Ile)-lysidine synthase n=1 Tax=Campylobacter blaseri TaxID=2042961 RepID=A0A2P8R1K3_9BACT|nr:tRNA lysidine(34) synthetase TilS [Campylobacter blaseri]PSM54136.1 tRNA lysidine(34) synthetase TilS [Campylobacter blaseri]
MLQIARQNRSILAFSYGVDSTALFYILVNLKIDFDLAFVNYNTRPSSNTEEESARELAKEFNKKIYVKNVQLVLEDSSNFEQKARDVRYKFFDEICTEFNYKYLITAHNLNDLFEWFLMRFSKGAGVCNLIGMSKIDPKQNYTILRPLLDTSKNEILNFLDTNEIKYFFDKSNLDTNFERNYIRSKFSNQFIQEFHPGVKKSFEFLNEDKKHLQGKFIYEDEKFFIIQNTPFSMNLIDKAVKKLGISMSQKQRLEASKDSVISGKIAIGYNEKLVCVSPFKINKMDKKFKEICRIKKVPKHNRGFIYENRHLLDKF